MYHYHISDSHRNKINNMFYNEIHYATITMKLQLYLDNYIYLFIGEQNAILIKGLSCRLQSLLTWICDIHVYKTLAVKIIIYGNFSQAKYTNMIFLGHSVISTKLISGWQGFCIYICMIYFQLINPLDAYKVNVIYQNIYSYLHTLCSCICKCM